MKQAWVSLLLVRATFGVVQGLYAGGSGSLSALSQDTPPFLGAQVGHVAGVLELRAVMETDFSCATVSADVMYAFRFPAGRPYLGAGPDALIFSRTSEAFPAVHTVFGGEYRPGSFGVFAETRAIIPLALTGDGA